jgi:hypothetical protein
VNKKIPERLERSVQAFLESDEKAEMAIVGLSSRWWMCVGPVHGFWAQRLVVLTDRNLYVCRNRGVHWTASWEVLVKYPLGAVRLKLEGHRLYVGTDQTISLVPLRSRRPAREVVERANERLAMAS